MPASKIEKSNMVWLPGDNLSDTAHQQFEKLPMTYGK